MADLSCDSTSHVYSPEGGMDLRINMASNRKFDNNEQFSDGRVQQTSLSTQIQQQNFQPGQRLGPKPCASHLTTARDGIDHSMGWPLCSIQQQHPTRPTERMFIETPPPACSVDTEPGCGSRLHRMSHDGQCLLDIDKSEDCRDPIRCISCGQPRGKTDYQQQKTGTSLPPPPEGLKQANTLLGFRQLCRNDPMESPDDTEAQTPHQHADDQCGEQKSNIAVSKLQEMVGSPRYAEYIEQLKEDRYGFHEVSANATTFYERELEYFSAVMDISSVRPMFMDDTGFVMWIVDGQGRMFLWSRMERCLEFMGDNILEGFKKYLEDPDNMLVWEKGAWVPKKELDRLGDEIYKRMMAKDPIVIPGNFTRWGTKKQKKQKKRKQKQKQK